MPWQELCEFVGERAESLEVPGAAVGILVEDEEHTSGFGITSVDNPLEVTPETLFQTGSITKTVTGTAAMSLVESGELDLDVPVRTYLPELRLADEDVASRVTMRHLLTHVGGWVGDYFDDFGAGDDALGRMVDTLHELPQLTPLGTLWSYNNAGFYVAGRVLEVVAGTPYETVVRDRVLAPLGMETSTMSPTDAMTRRFAVGHLAGAHGAEVAFPWPIPRAANPAGGLISNVVEMLRYARLHLGLLDGPLSRERVSAMQEPQAEAGSMADHVGITWLIRDVGGTRLYTHGGGTLGQNAWFEISPAHGYALVALSNSTRGRELVTEAARRARASFLGVAEPDPVLLESTPDELAGYVGTYETLAAFVHLVLDGEALVLRMEPRGGFPTRDSPPQAAPPPSRLGFTARDRVVALEGPLTRGRGEFIRDASGEIRWFRFGGRAGERLPARVSEERREPTAYT